MPDRHADLIAALRKIKARVEHTAPAHTTAAARSMMADVLGIVDSALAAAGSTGEGLECGAVAPPIPPAAGWRPIASAPAGTDVIVHIPTAKRRPVRMGRYGLKADGKRMWTYGGEFAFDVGIATEWQPLPIPPAPRAGRRRCRTPRGA